MNSFKKLLAMTAFLLVSIASVAQEKVSMADTMRSNGKIYVVVAVVLTILIGLILYMVRIDRKLTKLEKDI